MKNYKLSKDEILICEISKKIKNKDVRNFIDSEIYEIFKVYLKNNGCELSRLQSKMLGCEPYALSFANMCSNYERAKKSGTSIRGCVVELIKGFEDSYEETLEVFRLVHL